MFNDELLVMMVQAKETLYNTRLAAYKDVKAKAEMWEEIGSNLGHSGEYCEARWKKLRARYAKELRFHEVTSGSGANTQPRWYLFDTLEFMRPHIACRKHRSNAPQQTQELPNEILEDVQPLFSIFEEATPPTVATEPGRPRRDRRRQSTESDAAEQAFISAANAISQQVVSSCTQDPASRHFGNLVAEMLSNMPQHIRNHKMNKILPILTEQVTEEIFPS